MSTEIKIEEPVKPTSAQLAMISPEAATQLAVFDLQQRKARLFATSPLVPEHLRKNPTEAIANCYIAMVLAEQMGENPLVVMQNIYIVKGKAGWSASYMIAKANMSGVFKGVIRFKFEGEGTTLSCAARATLADTGEEVTSTVDWPMAVAEGWVSNSKYKSMPRQMLIYRSATFLIRTYCPQVMLGFHTTEENEDVAAAELASPRKGKLTMETVLDDGEVVETTEDAEVVEKPKVESKSSPDQLTELIKEYTAAGGVLSDFEGKYDTTMPAVEASRTAQRSKWISKFANEVRALKGDSTLTGGTGMPPGH